jgi:hypothetical protein
LPADTGGHRRTEVDVDDAPQTDDLDLAIVTARDELLALLQTEGYTRAMYQSNVDPLSSERIDEFIKMRMARQRESRRLIMAMATEMGGRHPLVS